METTTDQQALQCTLSTSCGSSSVQHMILLLIPFVSSIWLEQVRYSLSFGIIDLRRWRFVTWQPLTSLTTDPLDLLDIPRISCDFTPTFHAVKDRRSSNDNCALHGGTRRISCAVYSELDLSVCCRRLRRSDCHCIRAGSNRPLCRLFLHLLFKVSIYASNEVIANVFRVLKGQKFELPA